MRQLYIIACLSLLIINCGQRKPIEITESVVEKTDILFSDFLKLIPSQPLPIEISCGLSNGTVSSSQFEKFKDYIPQSADRIFGTIKSETVDFKLIIYGETGDDIYPILYSYDNEGNIIDTLFLILKGCGGADEKQIPHSFASITNNLTISLVDTTRMIHYPANSKSTDDYVVDSMRISKVIVRVDKKGHFVKQ